MNNNKPNFLIVGAAKSGTTSLAKYLSEHIDIFIPENKEPRYFVREVINCISPKDPLLDRILETSVLEEEQYFKVFDVKETVKGEASVHYLFHYHEAIPKIKSEIGDVPIIIMLRSPVKRLISNYEFLYNHHNNSLEKELSLEYDKKINKFTSFWFYKELGFYSHQVQAYMDNFSKVKIVLFEDFISDSNKQMNDIFEFLGVEPIKLKYSIYNKSKMNSGFKIFLKKAGVYDTIALLLSDKNKLALKSKLGFILNRQKKNEYDIELLNELKIFYADDIKKMELILNKSLSIWLD